MKGWKVALLCLAIAALAVAGTLLFIRLTEEEAPQVDIPRYTADQVIAVAKAYAGEECGSSLDVSWTTVYLGDGKWKVTKICTRVIPWSGRNEIVSKSDWTFYEATGELKSS